MVLGAFFLTLGCMRWSGVPVNAGPKSPSTLRLHLRGGGDVIVKNAVIRPDSIVGLPWGGGPVGSRIAVACEQVERVDVGETDDLKTTGLVFGLVAVVFGAFAWTVTHFRDP
jgi:hypothetical protein